MVHPTAGAGHRIDRSSPMTESRPQPIGAGERLAFLGVTIVNTTDGTSQNDMLVSVENGKIDAITPAPRFVADRSTRVIDARGKFMIPGYNDLHAHPLGSSDPEGSLTLLLANGVTGFREMGAWNDMLERRRAGTLISCTAPELLELAGEGINPGSVSTPEAAAAAVQSQIRRGADLIKLLDYTPAIFDAIVAECKHVNMRFMVISRRRLTCAKRRAWVCPPYGTHVIVSRPPGSHR